MKGDGSMKCLKIENGKGFFAQSNGKMQPIDKMTKDDILYLLSVATNSESEFEMDSLENHELLNEAHKIIYRSLYSKFFELLSNKTRKAPQRIKRLLINIRNNILLTKHID